MASFEGRFFYQCLLVMEEKRDDSNWIRISSEDK